MANVFKILYYIFATKTLSISRLTLFWNYLTIKFKTIGNSRSPATISLLGKKFTGADFFTLQYLYQEVFLKSEYHFRTKSAKPIIIDCGSNVGMAIYFFKKIYPDSHILGFEANPEVFKILQENIQGLGLSQVKVNNLALFNQNTEISFFTGNSNESLLGSIHSKRGGQKEVKVKAVKLSDYLLEFDEVDLIKIDVEGAEWKILEDLIESKTLRKAKQYLIEFHLNLPGMKEQMSDFLKYFEENGYVYNIRGEFGTVSEFQDLLIHCYRKD